LIFVVIGGDAVVMLGLRLALAIFLTSLLAWLWKPQEGSIRSEV
jgi:hypothetical protein